MFNLIKCQNETTNNDEINDEWAIIYVTKWKWYYWDRLKMITMMNLSEIENKNANENESREMMMAFWIVGIFFVFLYFFFEY